MTYTKVKYVTTIAQIAQKWGLVNGLEESYIVKWSKQRLAQVKDAYRNFLATTKTLVKDTGEKPTEAVMWNYKQYFINPKGGKTGERYEEEIENKQQDV